MSTDGLQDELLSSVAADVTTPLDAGDAIAVYSDDFTRWFNHNSDLHTGPILVLSTQPGDVVYGRVAPGFDPTVVLFGLNIVPERFINRACIGSIELQFDRFRQTRLIILHVQHKVGFT